MSCHFHLMRRRALAEATRKAAEVKVDAQKDKENAGKATKSRRKDDA